MLDGYQALARLLVGQNRLEEAQLEYEHITARDPRSVAAHTMAAVLLERQRKPQAAQKHYEQALAIDPNAAVSANNLAWMMVESNGNLDVALQFAQTARARLPERPEVNDTLGWIYFRKA